MGRPRGLPHDEIAALYRSGMRSPDIAQRYGCNERAIRHIAKKYKLAPRKGIHRPLRGPFNTAHPLLHQMFAHAALSGVTLRALSHQAGVSRQSINNWARRRSGPAFFALIAVAESLGLELTLRRKTDV
jgi:lambda repressor-like predicted transcriptional regulator